MIDPAFLSAVDWTAQTTPILVRYGSVPQIASDDEWRLWADQVLALPAVTGVNPPQHDGFQDWREWALRFNEAAAQLA